MREFNALKARVDALETLLRSCDKFEQKTETDEKTVLDAPDGSEVA